jgi:hypothetical protein
MDLKTRKRYSSVTKWVYSCNKVEQISNIIEFIEKNKVLSVYEKKALLEHAELKLYQMCAQVLNHNINIHL